MGWYFSPQSRSELIAELIAPQETERASVKVIAHALRGNVLWSVTEVTAKGLIDPLALVQRHVRGDWGETDEATRQANDVAIRGDDPMISHFRITPELVLIVKTSEDHQTTVIQLPEERDMI